MSVSVIPEHDFVPMIDTQVREKGGGEGRLVIMHDRNLKAIDPRILGGVG